MIPLDGLTFEDKDGEDGEDRNGNRLLNDFELHQVKHTAVSGKADAVGGNLKHIFRQCEQPRQHDDKEQRRVVGNHIHRLEFQMPVPSERHKDVRHEKHPDSIDGIHNCIYLRINSSEKSKCQFNESEDSVIDNVIIIGVKTFRDDCFAVIIFNLFDSQQFHKNNIRQ